MTECKIKIPLIAHWYIKRESLFGLIQTKEECRTHVTLNGTIHLVNEPKTGELLKLKLYKAGINGTSLKIEKITNIPNADYIEIQTCPYHKRAILCSNDLQAYDYINKIIDKNNWKILTNKEDLLFMNLAFLDRMGWK